MDPLETPLFKPLPHQIPAENPTDPNAYIDLLRKINARQKAQEGWMQGPGKYQIAGQEPVRPTQVTPPSEGMWPIARAVGDPIVAGYEAVAEPISKGYNAVAEYLKYLTTARPSRPSVFDEAL